jgi:hypothetical protein
MASNQLRHLIKLYKKKMTSLIKMNNGGLVKWNIGHPMLPN